PLTLYTHSAPYHCHLHSFPTRRSSDLKFKLPPFIATLGTMMVARGLGSIVSNVQSITFPLRGAEDGFYKNLFRLSNNFPVGIFLFIGIAIIAAIVLNKTKIGRYIYAIGSNREATRLSGVNIVRWETV